jgi:hypothetical protein
LRHAEGSSCLHLCYLLRNPLQKIHGECFAWCVGDFCMNVE